MNGEVIASQFYLNGEKRTMAHLNTTSYNTGFYDQSILVSGFINATADSAEINNSTGKKYIMYNGNYVRVYSDGWGLTCALYDANDNLIGTCGWTTGGSSWYRNQYYIMFIRNTDNGKI